MPAATPHPLYSAKMRMLSGSRFLDGCSVANMRTQSVSRSPAGLRPLVAPFSGRVAVRLALLGTALLTAEVIVAQAGRGAALPTVQITSHLSEVYSIEFLPFRSDQLLTSSRDALISWPAAWPERARRLVDRDRLLGYSVAPDGSRVVVTTLSGARILWMNSGEIAHEFDIGLLRDLLWPEWSPSGDRIATRSRAAVHLWHAATGERLRTIDLAGARMRWPLAIAWAPNGERIAVLGRLGALGVFRAGDGSTEFETQAHDVVSAHLSWSSDGRLLATGANDGLVKLWDSTGWALKLSLLNEGNILLNGRSPIDALEFSPDGQRIAVATPSASLRLWATDSGEELFHWGNLGEAPYAPHRGQVRDIAFSPDGRHLITAGSDRSVKVWNAENGTQAASYAGFLNSMNSVAWSSDGSRFAAAGQAGAAVVWDSATGREVSRSRGHMRGRVLSLSFATHVPRVVTSGSDGVVRVWHSGAGSNLFDISLYGERHRPGDPAARPASWVSYSPLSNRVALLSDFESGRELQIATVAASAQPPFSAGYSVQSAAWSPNGLQLAMASSYYVSVLDLEQPDRYPVVLEQPSAGDDLDYKHVSWSRDGERVLAASRAGAISWEWRSGRVVGQVQPEDGAVHAEESADGSLLLTLNGSFRLPVAQVWDAVSQTQVAQIAAGRSRIRQARFLMGGERLVTRYGRNPRPAIWDARSGQQLLKLEGHTRPVGGMAITRDGMRVATGSSDGTVRLWDAETGVGLAVMASDLTTVSGVEFSPAGTLIGAHGLGGARIWEVDPATMPVEEP